MTQRRQSLRSTRATADRSGAAKALPAAADRLDDALALGAPPRLVPKGAKERRFCLEYVRDFNALEAARRAGYTETMARKKAYALVHEHHDYIQWLRMHQAKANAQQIAIEIEPVLQEIAKIAFANEYDYLVFEPGEKLGEPPKVRRKRLDELTRDQMAAIQVFKRPNGELDYRLRDKDGRLIDLLKHLGGFSEKLILEHRHQHLHMKLDLTNVPLEELEALERQFEDMLRSMGNGRVIEAR